MIATEVYCSKFNVMTTMEVFKKSHENLKNEAGTSMSSREFKSDEGTKRIKKITNHI